MAIPKYRNFDPNDELPASWTDAIQQFLASHMAARLQRKSNTVVSVRVPAGTEGAAISVQGLFRFVEADVDLTLSGSSGVRYLWAVASANSFSNSPSPDMDNTDYTFGLKATTTTSAPTGTHNGNAITATRLLGTCFWDGSQISPGSVLSELRYPHAATHVIGADDPLTPANIGASDLAHAARHARGGADTIPGLPPIGFIGPYAGDGDPSGGDWLLCDGRTVAIASFPALDAIIGNAATGAAKHKYNGGASPGAGLLKLPDLRGRTTVGADNMGTAAGAAGRLPNSNRLSGQNGGEEKHTLLSGESGVPAHTHTASSAVTDPGHIHTASSSVTDPGHVHTFSGATVVVLGPGGAWTFSGAGDRASITQTATATTGVTVATTVNTHTTGVTVATTVNNATATDAAAAHNNMQPYEVENFIIRAL